jgi:hypothetical protein
MLDVLLGSVLAQVTACAGWLGEPRIYRHDGVTVNAQLRAEFYKNINKIKYLYNSCR